jgi:hypothetical protein
MVDVIRYTNLERNKGLGIGLVGIRVIVYPYAE